MLIIIMWITRVFLVVGLCVVFANTKKYDSRCKLARDLIRLGAEKGSLLGQWVCLIEKVSKRDTNAFKVTSNGKKHYGLYQIPNRWCREGKRGGECNLPCESLLDDDIRDDTACAKLIENREGFKYWSIWSTRCRDDNMITSEIYKCPDLYQKRLSPEMLTYRNNMRYRRMLAARYTAVRV